MSRLQFLPKQDRPTHRVAEAPAACNSIELLAALVGGSQQIEIAEALLQRFGSLRTIYNAAAEEIASVKGIGAQTAARLRSALELGSRLNVEVAAGSSINSPASAAALVQHKMSLLEVEELWVILLNTRNHVLDIVELYRGSVNSSQVRVGEVFRDAVRVNAAAIIVAHNHPTGDASPSPEDVAVTRAIVEAGKLLDIEVLDHIVIGGKRWVSLKERNLGFL